MEVDVHMDDDEIARLQQMTAANANLLTKNTFNVLDDLDDDWEDLNKQPKRQRRETPATGSRQPQKSGSPPPLVVTHSNISQIHTELAAADVKDYTMKLTSDGTRIFIKNIDDYLKVKQYFKDNNKKFFTHSLKEDQLVKFVLCGLHKMTPEEVSDAISKAFKTPQMVKPMKIRSTRHDSHALYLVFFLKKDKIKLKDLQDIRVVNYMRVRWENYENRRTGPSQCSNCQRFGHGALHCHAEPRCIRCAGSHSSKECPLLKTDKGETLVKIPNDLLMCVHCKQNHTANYTGCSKRAEFIKMRQAATAKSKQKQPVRATNRFAFEHASQLNGAYFPSITSQSNSIPAWTKAANQSPPQQAPRIQNSNLNGENNSILKIDEMFSIYSEMVEILTVARTRQDQISALMKLALKFVAPLYV
jgi:hypothetical protein